MKKLISVITAAALVLSFSGCGKKQEPEKKVTKEKKVESTVYNSVLEPMSETKVIPKSKGQIADCPYEVGDSVAAGTLLYTLDDNGLSDNISTTKNAISKANISINTARENVNNLKVYAPASGILKEFKTKTGERVNVGNVGQIANDVSAVAKIPFTAAQLQQIKKGDSARVISADYMSSVPGTVTRIYDEKAQSVGGSILYNVEITIKDAGSLASGSVVDAEITTSSGVCTSAVSGTLEAPETVPVVSKGSGNAIAVYAKEGQSVKKGQLLIECENNTVSSTLSRAELDKKDLEIKLAKYEKDYSDLFIYAPAGGVITQKNKKTYDNITSKRESIMTISDIATMKSTFYVTKGEAAKLSEGDIVQLTLTDDDTQIAGTVMSVNKDGEIDGTKKEYPVVITVSNDSGLLPDEAVSVKFGG